MSKNGWGGEVEETVSMFLPDNWISEGSNSLKEVKLNDCMTSREESLYPFRMLALQ